VGRELPRQRLGAHRRHARRARSDRGGLQAGAGRNRHRRADGDHQPVHRPGLQGRRVHVQRSEGARLRAAQDPARDRPGRRAGREGIRLLGRARGHRNRLQQERARGGQALPRGAQLPVRLCARPGLRSEVRAGSQAQRAAQRHLPADDRRHARLHRHARSPGDGRRQPGGRPRAHGRPQLHARGGPGLGRREAVSHRPERSEVRALRSGLPLRRGDDQAGVLPGQVPRGCGLRWRAPL